MKTHIQTRILQRIKLPLQIVLLCWAFFSTSNTSVRPTVRPSVRPPVRSLVDTFVHPSIRPSVRVGPCVPTYFFRWTWWSTHGESKLNQEFNGFNFCIIGGQIKQPCPKTLISNIAKDLNDQLKVVVDVMGKGNVANVMPLNRDPYTRHGRQARRGPRNLSDDGPQKWHTS